VPIRAGTIPEAIPDPQKKPGKHSQNNKNQIGQSRLFPHPSKNDKQDDTGMEYKEKNIQKGVHILCLYQYFIEACNLTTQRDESFFVLPAYIQVGMGKENEK
jgi:hypothetical protein